MNEFGECGEEDNCGRNNRLFFKDINFQVILMLQQHLVVADSGCGNMLGEKEETNLEMSHSAATFGGLIVAASSV